MNAAPDLDPVFPLPARGDQVQVAVTTQARTAPGLLSAGPEARWCRVVSVDTGPYDLFPVTVRLPSGRLGAYQQHEIRGWRPAWWRRIPGLSR
jgi:hypothetical protein